MSALPDHSRLIVDVARRGDRQAFSRLFEHFAPRVKAYVMRMGAPPETAEELAQETLLTLWRRAASFDPHRASASTWIFAIARNLRIDLARRERRPLPGEEPAQIDEARPDEALELVQDARRIAQALAALPQSQVEAIRLAFFADKAHTEVARELSLPLGTVKSRIRLGIARLRELLEEDS